MTTNQVYKETGLPTTDILNGNALVILGHVMQSDADARPKIRDLQHRLGFKTPSGALYHLRRLKESGLLTYEEHQAGTVRPTCRFISVAELFSDESESLSTAIREGLPEARELIDEYKRRNAKH